MWYRSHICFDICSFKMKNMSFKVVLGADHLIFDGGVSRFSLCPIFFLHLLVLLDIFLPFITLARYFFSWSHRSHHLTLIKFGKITKETII